MKKRLLKISDKQIYTLLILLCIIGFWVFDNFYTPATNTPPNSNKEATLFPDYLMPSSTSSTIVKHRHFSLSYRERYEQAEWVGYLLDKSHLTYDDRERPYFIEDPKVKSKSADWKNYKGSGYDRGHLCPAGDRRFTSYAYKETFYTSNISPQRPDFNAGIWNRLEKQIRSWAKRYGRVYVITGGVLKEGLTVIGEEEVAVPEIFYKIVVRGEKEKLEILAFLIPHRESTSALKDYLVTVDTIERLSGIDFFENLDRDLENALENKVVSRGWDFNL